MYRQLVDVRHEAARPISMLLWDCRWSGRFKVLYQGIDDTTIRAACWVSDWDRMTKVMSVLHRSVTPQCLW